MLRPRVFFIKSGLSLFLAGIGRIDYVTGMQPIRLFVYASLKLPMLVCETEKAEEIYTDLLPTDALQVPQNTIERSSPWTGLKCAKELNLMGNYSSLTVADIVFGSIGWIGVNGNKDHEISLRVWSPDAQGVSLRQPALLEEGFRLRGKRIRDSVAHKIGKAFIKQ
uniref:Putative secreted protein n=1 Tax=Lutzomyia longipalpis TaxID=7200 RepID=A0A7G3ANE3_LUTLO